MLKLQKHILLLLMSYSIVMLVHAQVIVTPQLPPAGLLQKKQLWNLIMVNNNNYSQDVQVQLSMTDRTTGQQILNASSRMITLTKGASQLKETDLAPIHYNFSGIYSTTDGNAGDLLMAGSYMICYTIITSDAYKKGSPTSEECVSMDIEPLSPAQLLSPADTSTITTPHPNFNWIPPAPMAMFNNLQYEILIAEVQKGQNPYDALQRNTIVYRQQQLVSPLLMYPSSAKALEPGKKYAWQILVYNNRNYIQKTEAWSFSVKEDSSTVITDGSLYPLLTKGGTAGTYASDGRINFEYNNETGDTLVAVHIYDIKDHPKTLVETKKIEIKPGQNFINLKIRTGLYKTAQHYLLEIANSRMEYWNLKFKYVKGTRND